jgi:hypothetical protein
LIFIRNRHGRLGAGHGPHVPDDPGLDGRPAENAIPMNVALASIRVIIKDGRIFKNLSS